MQLLKVLVDKSSNPALEAHVVVRSAGVVGIEAHHSLMHQVQAVWAAGTECAKGSEMHLTCRALCQEVLITHHNTVIWRKCTYRSHCLSKNLLLAKKCLDTRPLPSCIYLYGNLATKLNTQK